MHARTLAAVVPIAVGVAIAGCGSSSSSSSAGGSASGGSASTPASTSSSAGGAYGHSATASSPSRVALITTKHSTKLGTILAVGPKKLTVYLFEGDKAGSSRCVGTCASVWPPVLGSPKALGGAVRADLGVTTRPDGSKQVTYKGHPLYMFVKDKDDGDAYGEALKEFGAEWYALAASGHKVDLS